MARMAVETQDLPLVLRGVWCMRLVVRGYAWPLPGRIPSKKTCGLILRTRRDGGMKENSAAVDRDSDDLIFCACSGSVIALAHTHGTRRPHARSTARPLLRRLPLTHALRLGLRPRAAYVHYPGVVPRPPLSSSALRRAAARIRH